MVGNKVDQETFVPRSVPEIFDRSVSIIVRSALPILLVGIVYGAIPSIVAGHRRREIVG
jgi:hypothetical protein